MIGSDTALRRRVDVRYRVVEGQAVVIVQKSAEALVLNPVGTRVLELIDGELSVGGLLRRLEEEYEVDPMTLRRDVLDYLRQLLEAGVVEVVEPGVTR